MEIIVKSKTELKQEADNLIAEVNKMVLEDGSAGDIAKKLEAVSNTLGDYATVVKHEAYCALRDADNTMEATIRQMTYDVLVVHEDKSGERAQYELETRAKYVDLLDLQKFCEKNIGHDRNWFLMVDKFAMQMAMRIATEIGADPKFVERRYKIDPKALGINLSDETKADPTSNTQLLKTLQKVMDSMLYLPKTTGKGKAKAEVNAYKATSHDVAWFILTLTKASNKKAHSLSYANIKTIRQMLMRMMNKIVTSSTYGLDFKALKDGEADNAIDVTPDITETEAA